MNKTISPSPEFINHLMILDSMASMQPKWKNYYNFILANTSKNIYIEQNAMINKYEAKKVDADGAHDV